MWSPRAAFKKRKKRRWNSIRGDACTIQIIHTGEKHHSVLISYSVFCSSFLEMRVLVVYSQKWSRKPAFLEGLSAEMSLLLCESSMPVNGLLWWSVWHPCATLLSGIVPPLSLISHHLRVQSVVCSWLTLFWVFTWETFSVWDILTGTRE